jgi:hypothetical protein
MAQSTDFTKTTRQLNKGARQNFAKTFKELDQSGKIINKKRDLGRIALTPGKRISKNGKVYWETRINRSDRSGSRL